MIDVDFTQYQYGTSITNQYTGTGVTFSGLNNPNVFIGAAYFGNGSNGTGLTHSVTNPFPGAVNGISAYFLNPISFISVDVHANRIGSSLLMDAFDINGLLINQYSYYQPDFYKDHASLEFSSAVSRIKWYSSEPNQTPVAIRNLSFKIPEPNSLFLFLPFVLLFMFRQQGAALAC